MLISKKKRHRWVVLSIEKKELSWMETETSMAIESCYCCLSHRGAFYSKFFNHERESRFLLAFSLSLSRCRCRRQRETKDIDKRREGSSQAADGSAISALSLPLPLKLKLKLKLKLATKTFKQQCSSIVSRIGSKKEKEKEMPMTTTKTYIECWNGFQI